MSVVPLVSPGWGRWRDEAYKAWRERDEIVRAARETPHGAEETAKPHFYDPGFFWCPLCVALAAVSFTPDQEGS